MTGAASTSALASPELIARPRAPRRRPRHPEPFELERADRPPLLHAGRREAAITRLRHDARRGPARVLLTSLRTEETPADAIDVLAGEAGRFCLLRTALLPIASTAPAMRSPRCSCSTASEAAARRGAGTIRCAVYGVLRRTAAGRLARNANHPRPGRAGPPVGSASRRGLAEAPFAAVKRG